MSLADVMATDSEVSVWSPGDAGEFRLADAQGWDDWGPVWPDLCAHGFSLLSRCPACPDSGRVAV